MSNHNDLQKGAINLTTYGVVGPENEASSLLTSPYILSDYVIVDDLNAKELSKSADMMESLEDKFTGSTKSNVSISTVQFNAECSTARKLTHVCSKYQEAAIYLKEGAENEQLCDHPTDVKSYWAYTAIHHPAYYITEVIVCVLLMLLAFLERPQFFEDVPVQVAPSLELLFLLYISSDIILKLIRIKPKFTFKHRRTVFKCILLVVMTAEAVVVLGRGNPHVRVTRALRPLFLMDTALLRDVRRILWQILQSLGPIIDVLILFFFFICLFAVAGFYLFYSCSSTHYEFKSFQESFIDLYILATTANFPDIMMECYNHHEMTPIFFVIFLIITLYIISSILIPTVYSTFQDNQKEKFKNLYLHRRNALRYAFYILATGEHEDRTLPLRSYLKMMEYYSPYTSNLIGVCTFKAMMKDNEGEPLSIEEFYSFYDIQKLSWNKVTGRGEKIRWYHVMPDAMYTKLRLLTKAVESVYFKAIINLIILCNALYFFILTAHIEDPDKHFRESRQALAINLTFAGIYILEIIVRLIALGPLHYFKQYWNIFDFVVIITTFVIQMVEIHQPLLIFIIPLRFVRLVRFNKRLRAIFNTLAVLLPQIINIILLLILIYYFFAIIGMEIFHDQVEPGCCGDDDIGRYYEGNGSNVYHLNNFNNLPRSYVTLFELMVVNNWWIIMEGFSAAVDNSGSRAFFICFHLTTVIVLATVIAFMFDAFVLKIQFAQQRFFAEKKDEYIIDGEFIKRFEVEVKMEEIEMLEENFKRPYWSWELPAAFRERITATIPQRFQGIRRSTRGDLHKQLYKDYLEEWIEEDERLLESSYHYNPQTPMTLSTAFQKLKDEMLCILVYIFE